jgi:hypothetical protein
MLLSRSGTDRLLADKLQSCQQNFHCLFDNRDWDIFGVELSSLQSLIFPERQESERRVAGLRRRVILACLQDKSVRFYRKRECPVSGNLILSDYSDDLADSAALLHLIDVLRRIGPPAVMQQPTLRILVEFFSRNTEVASPLLPHEDGCSCLFFMSLYNSMVGGEMKLFRSRGSLSSLSNKRMNGTDFYREDDLELLHLIRCEAGNGYFADEHGEPDSRRILHGCNGWHFPQEGTGTRAHLRISFSFRRPTGI